MAKRTEKLLERFGLSEKQSLTYLAALHLGKAGMRELAVRSGLNRTTLYEIVDQLCSLGLLIPEGKGWGRKFTPADPKTLHTLIESKKLALEDMLPELSKLYADGPHHNAISRVEGRAAIRSAYEGLIADVDFKEFYLVMSDLEKWTALDKDFFKEFARRRTSKIRDTRLLVTGGALAEQRLREGDKLRRLPAELSLSINLVITPRQVILHHLTQPEYLLTLYGSSTVEMFRQIFEILWRQAK